MSQSIVKDGADQELKSDGAAKSLVAWGTWGGETATMTVSPDGGVTLIPLKDQNGDPLVLSENSLEVIDKVGAGLQYVATLSGVIADLQIRVY